MYSNSVSFQFHSGSIKTTGALLGKVKRARFNSTLVRLRLRHRLAHLLGTNTFQFHSGSIKTKRWGLRRNLDESFQFHSGSIKTWLTTCGPTTAPTTSFNSTLVRLRRGRLRPPEDRRAFPFQFHSGSIKTNLSGSSARRALRGFNSTLVRLRLAERRAAHGHNLPSFNSTLVRLRLLPVREVRHVVRRFNSTLVRLRLDDRRVACAAGVGFNSTLVRLRPTRRPALAVRHKFQFHSGSIKT